MNLVPFLTARENFLVIDEPGRREGSGPGSGLTNSSLNSA